MELDPIRTVFWESFRHLFPAYAKVAQTATGCLFITWSIKGAPEARFPYATPITVRFEEELTRAMEEGTPQERQRLARGQEAALRAGMVGYDPFAAVPKARVIVLG